MFSGENDVCGAEFISQPDNMPDHGGNQSYELWSASPIFCQLSYKQAEQRTRIPKIDYYHDHGIFFNFSGANINSEKRDKQLLVSFYFIRYLWRKRYRCISHNGPRQRIRRHRPRNDNEKRGNCHIDSRTLLQSSTCARLNQSSSKKRESIKICVGRE